MTNEWLVLNKILPTIKLVVPEAHIGEDRYSEYIECQKIAIYLSDNGEIVMESCSNLEMRIPLADPNCFDKDRILRDYNHLARHSAIREWIIQWELKLKPRISMRMGQISMRT